MNDLLVTTLLIAALFLLLGSGVWIGLTLAGVAWIGMQLFSARPAGDAMAVGTVVLLIAFIDEWLQQLRGRRSLEEPQEALHNE